MLPARGGTTSDGNKDDKKEKIIAIVFINSNIYEATDVRDVCCRVAFIMFMKK